MTDLLTTKEAARLLGVGTTSIKRWSDAGELACVKTPGGHRRFPREAVTAMLERGGPLLDAIEFDDSLEGWVSLLVRGTDQRSAGQRLLREKERLGSWARTADELTPVLAEIGRRWEVGELTILHEHIASERLIRGITQCCQDLVPPKENQNALLLTADGDDHTIGLHLVELSLREGGWNTRWSGPRTPFAALEPYIAAGECQMLAVSASRFSRDSVHLADQARALGELCQKHDITLLLGGQGAWPRNPHYGLRVETFSELAVVMPAATAMTSH